VDSEVAVLSDDLMRRLREVFRPEFLNRVDEIIVFQRLQPAQLRQIVELLLEQTRRRLHAQDVGVEFTPAAIDWIAERGYEPEFGARPMRRTIQREIDNRLSGMLLGGQLPPGGSVTVDANGGGLSFDIHTGQSAAVSG
jgi:ATP-dependent Clp protease ATP-binding subunit ClpC